jgi:hypothetical protein
MMNYISIIREQIVRDIQSLRRGHWSQPNGVRIGYILNSHKGHPIFRDADIIDDLPVRIDFHDTMTICLEYEPWSSHYNQYESRW